jgi:hypothetical protein
MNSNALAIPHTDARTPLSRTVAHPKPKPEFRRRVQHLAFIRLLPCVACGSIAVTAALLVISTAFSSSGMMA